ncbi:flavin adenine dinucleotide transporter FLC2 NDAI_0H02000 [Naumovozyma dairenensis CBS 421]|uniref:ML-like domain-containing protein n=1 Tax=Naumovozyma dairenensis (strain ATCC 10597 / BCRC 20456 / CBS 421 / NBRC 0211 / NRRL Y-12639) TaxID=1071378 RepID=G0WF13_NAUDC|nr:hypothetical protein NDAI_0H02000 [Naumovozyma dairenensis CBS 421]CCD26374.1 hypothetical protein NDAI_0H02000 [Naumovozyma dairenensis CBS 421]
MKLKHSTLLCNTFIFLSIFSLLSNIIFAQDVPNIDTGTTATDTDTDTNTNTAITTSATSSSSSSSSSSSTSSSSSASASSSSTSQKVSTPSKLLRTDSLLTCMDNSGFTASFFDISYYPHNKTAIFNIDATTTINENIIVKVELLVYGLKVIDRSFDLCSLNEVSLCPLSAGRIDVSSSYQLDDSIAKQIPAIAYTIPDLDAQVRVVAYSQNDTSFTTPIACVQAIVSNDKTVQTKYASWPIAAISGVGLLTSGFVSVIGYSSTSAHIASNSISLFVYFQNLAITAMMGVSRVPPIAAAWTQNFQWSMGIINAEFMQKIFNWYIQATKGISTVVVSNKDILSISVQKKRKRDLIQLFKRATYTVVSSNDYNFDSILDDSKLYTTDERNTDEYSSRILVLRGIQRVAFKANIELSNFFLTGIVFFLFFLFCMILALIFFKALIEVLTRARLMAETSNFFQYRKNWASIIKGTLFRLAIIAFPQVSLLTIWEFTQVDSPAVIVDAVFIFIIITALLIYGTVRVFIKGRESLRLYKNAAYLLYSDSNFLNRYGFLYVQFRADAFWWLLPMLSYSFLRSLFVAVLQEQGKAQAMVIFVIELIFFVCLCWIRPYLDKRTNIFNIAIHLVNLINSIFFLFFSNLFKQPPIVSSVMAVILFVLNAAFALFLLCFTIITCTLALVHRNPDVRYQPMKDDRVSFIPKITNNNNNDGTTDSSNNSNIMMTNYDKNKSEAELFELRQAVMDTNETEQEKMIRDDTFHNKGGFANAGESSRILFNNDDLDDEAISNYTSSSLSRNNPYTTTNNEDSIVQPTSAVMGSNNLMNSPSFNGRNQGYLKIPTTNPSATATATERSRGGVKKPETSFYGGHNNNTNPSYRNNSDIFF